MSGRASVRPVSSCSVGPPQSGEREGAVGRCVLLRCPKALRRCHRAKQGRPGSRYRSQGTAAPEGASGYENPAFSRVFRGGREEKHIVEVREGRLTPPAAGFSFTETAVVLLVLAVVAGAMGFAASAGTRQGLELAADMVAAEIRRVREMNRGCDGRVYVVQFDRWNDRYLVKEGLRVLKIGSLPPGVDLVWTNFPYDQLGFNTMGVPVPRGGTLALCDRSGRYLYVVVTSVTGRVRVATAPPPGGRE